MDVALNAKFNLKAVQYDTQWDTSSSVDKDEPMDHSHAKEEADLRHAKEEADLQVAEQQRSIRICYMCGRTRHFRS